MKTTKQTYSVTLPDGRVATKNSSLAPTHAVAAVYQGQWYVNAWCGSHALAVKAAARLPSETRVIEVSA